MPEAFFVSMLDGIGPVLLAVENFATLSTVIWVLLRGDGEVLF